MAKIAVSEILLKSYANAGKADRLMYLLFVSALSIHVSPKTKEVLDNFESFHLEERQDEVYLKVGLSASFFSSEKLRQITYRVPMGTIL